MPVPLKLAVPLVLLVVSCATYLFSLSPARDHHTLPPDAPHHALPPDAPHRCLSLHSPNPPIDHSRQSCSPLPSATPAFSLHLCHDPTLCNAFTLRIARTDTRACQALERANRQLSDDPDLDAWIKTHLGPDTFELRTDGAERVAPQAVYEGACRWRFDVSLRNAGPVWISAWHTYEYYQAFDEKNGTWPNALQTPLFSDPVSLDICSPFCAPTPPALLNPHRSLLSYPSPAAHHTYPALPPCSDTHPVAGSYLPLHPWELLHPALPLPQSAEPGTPVAGRYRFVPHGCAWTHAGRRFEDHARCVNTKRKIVVVGDSHGRVVADGLHHRLSGNDEIMTQSEKSGHKSHQVGELAIDFWWDPKGEEASCSPGGAPLADADALVLSVAQHFVWGPTSEYLAALTRLLDLYAACPRPPSRPPLRLVYLATPAWPARRDYWVSHFDDQRTNARLGRWRDVAAERARARGWAVVDQFALARAVVWEVLRLDGAHLLGTDALDAVLDEVLGKAGVCGGP